MFVVYITNINLRDRLRTLENKQSKETIHINSTKNITEKNINNRKIFKISRVEDVLIENR